MYNQANNISNYYGPEENQNENYFMSLKNSNIAKFYFISIKTSYIAKTTAAKKVDKLDPNI